MEPHGNRDGLIRTLEAIQGQIRAIPSPVYEVGLYQPAARRSEPDMLLRTWDAEILVGSVSWLRWQNSQGRNIYIRPAGEHQFSLIDDLSRTAVERLKKEGFTPAAVIETSAGNFQAWLNHGELLPKDLSTAAARALAQRFGGDQGAADWRHFGRLAGFTNRKGKYRSPKGLQPFVHLIEARGDTYPMARQFVGELRVGLKRQALERERLREYFAISTGDRSAGRSIDTFRTDPRYGGDGNRIDLAYAIYAVSHGVPEGTVRAAIANRDLTKKGTEKRQQEYIDRTIEKARQIATPPMMPTETSPNSELKKHGRRSR